MSKENGINALTKNLLVNMASEYTALSKESALDAIAKWKLSTVLKRRFSRDILCLLLQVELSCEHGTKTNDSLFFAILTATEYSLVIIDKGKLRNQLHRICTFGYGELVDCEQSLLFGQIMDLLFNALLSLHNVSSVKAREVLCENNFVSVTELLDPLSIKKEKLRTRSK